MKDKRDRIKSEEASLNFRVPVELKSIILEHVSQQNQTVSEYLRELLTMVHDGSYCHEATVVQQRKGFLFSSEFLRLMVWIYKKREHRKMGINVELLETYITTLKKVNEHFPDEISKEFDKVLLDLLRVRADFSGQGSLYVDFPNDYRQTKRFDYEKVESFILTTDFKWDSPH